MSITDRMPRKRTVSDALTSPTVIKIQIAPRACFTRESLACGMRASSASARASRTGASSIRSRMSWKKPRTISRSASARVRPRAMA